MKTVFAPGSSWSAAATAESAGARGRRDQARLRVEPAGAHLVGEAGQRREVALERRCGDERAAAGQALYPPLAAELVERAADGDQTAAEVVGELALDGQSVAGRPAAGVELRRKFEVELVVKRDRAALKHAVGDGLAVCVARRALDSLR